MSEKAVIEITESTDLAVRFSDSAVQKMSNQRSALKQFVHSQMIKDQDYGTIPGTPKPTLYKPGAEKLANIFQLGYRILGDPEKIIDQNPPGFAMFTYTIEVFHIPTGQSLAQCQGSANSNERKYKKVALADLFNTLQKMAQKRAYVGAIVSAVGASDLFTQDIEDLQGTGLIPEEPRELNSHYQIKYGRCKFKTLADLNNPSGKESLNGYLKWIADTNVTAPGVLAEKEIVEGFLRNPELFK